MSKKEPFSLFKVVAENLSSNELGLKTKLKEQKNFLKIKLKNLKSENLLWCFDWR